MCAARAVEQRRIRRCAFPVVSTRPAHGNVGGGPAQAVDLCKREGGDGLFRGMAPCFLPISRRLVENACTFRLTIAELASAASGISFNPCNHDFFQSGVAPRARKPTRKHMIGYAQRYVRRQAIENLFNLLRDGKFLLQHGFLVPAIPRNRKLNRRANPVKRFTPIAD
jgi:hypothetical protein